MKHNNLITSDDYTIQNNEGKFFKLDKNGMVLTSNPYESASFFEDDAKILVKDFQTEPLFTGCKAVKRDEAIKIYENNKKKTF